jgi:hypothetical protein
MSASTLLRGFGLLVRLEKSVTKFLLTRSIEAESLYQSEKLPN